MIRHAILISFVIMCVNSVKSFDFMDFQGDLNVLETLGFKIPKESNSYIRLQKNFNNTNAHFWKATSSKIRQLKSFIFECVFRIDESISRNLEKYEFILFSLENIQNSKNVLEIGLNTERSLKFDIKSHNYNDSTITFDKVMPNSWYKLMLSYQNGIMEYWFDCISKQTASQIYPIELAVHYSTTEEVFQFSVGYLKSRNFAYGTNFGNFDISKMKFYSGYLRPYEYDCCDVPKVCSGV